MVFHRAALGPIWLGPSYVLPSSAHQPVFHPHNSTKMAPVKLPRDLLCSLFTWPLRRNQPCWLLCGWDTRLGSQAITHFGFPSNFLAVCFFSTPLCWLITFLNFNYYKLAAAPLTSSSPSVLFMPFPSHRCCHILLGMLMNTDISRHECLWPTWLPLQTHTSLCLANIITQASHWSSKLGCTNPNTWLPLTAPPWPCSHSTGSKCLRLEVPQMPEFFRFGNICIDLTLQVEHP